MKLPSKLPLPRLPQTFSPIRALEAVVDTPALTNQQSDQLLGLLKTSFRYQLAAASKGPSVDATDYPAVPSNKPAAQIPTTIPTFASPGDSHFSQILQAPPFAAADGLNQQQRFLSDPLGAYRDLYTHASPPQVSVAVTFLKQYTSKVLSIPAEEREEDWAVKTVLDVIRPYWLHSPRFHIENDVLRIEVIRTLVQGGKSDVAIAMLKKDWLLNISADEPRAKSLLSIRARMVKDLMHTMKRFLGTDAAAVKFLGMIEMWKSSGGDLPGNMPGLVGGDNSAQQIPLLDNKILPFNPFAATAREFLIHYAKERSPELSALRRQLYEACAPWVRNSLARGRLAYYYKGTTGQLYKAVIKALDRSVQDAPFLRQLFTESFELIQALVNESEIEKAKVILELLRGRAGEVPGFEVGMVEEIEELLGSQEKDITSRLMELLSSITLSLNPITGFHWDKCSTALP